MMKIIKFVLCDRQISEVTRFSLCRRHISYGELQRLDYSVVIKLSKIRKVTGGITSIIIFY